MSTYTQLPTFKTLNMNISNDSRLALAPPDILSTSSAPQTPFWGFTRRSLLPGQSFGVSDFQSNARVENHAKSSSPSLAGLGIYTDLAYENSRMRATPVLDLSPFCVTLQHQSNNPLTLDQRLGNNAPAEAFTRLEPQLPDSWSFGSNISSSMFTSTADDVAAQVPDVLDGLSLQYPTMDDPGLWSFDSLSSVSGISVELLAEQLSAAADLALQQISSALVDPISSAQDVGVPFSNNATQSPRWPVLPCGGDDLTAAPETKLHQYSARWAGDSIGVNPVEVMGNLDQSLEPYPPSMSAGSHLSSLFSSDSFFVDALASSSDSHMSQLSSLHSNTLFPCDESTQKHQLDSIPELLTSISVDPGDRVQNSKTEERHDFPKFEEPQEEDENSEYEPPRGQCLSSKESSPFPSPRQKKRKRTTKKKGDPKPVKIIPRNSDHLVRGHIVKAEELEIDLGSPVFDAHKGVPLLELKAKAERYSLRNPGKEYDRRWLILFAGKLSVQGELIADFRCYVAGCTQINKRRDHILIHVGAHLDQRPFGCIHWYAKFETLCLPSCFKLNCRSF